MEKFEINFGNGGDKEKKENEKTDVEPAPHHVDETGRVISEDEFRAIKKERKDKGDFWREQK